MRLPLAAALVCLLASLCACVGMPSAGDADISDPGIQANIETSLHSMRHINLATLSIDVHSRIVTLSGLVDSYEQREAIQRAAKETRGVEQVINNLVIRE